MTRLLVIVLAALLIAAPAAGAKKPAKSHGSGAKACKVSGKHGDKARAARSCARKHAATAGRRCRTERRELGAAAFRARYGGKRRAFGRCVSSRARSGKGGRNVAEEELADDEAELEDEELEEEIEIDDELEDDERDADEDAADDEDFDAFEEDLEL